MPAFDFEEVFGPDYLHFYDAILTPERSDEAVEVIRRLLGLEPGMAVLDAACGHGRIANRLARLGCRVVGVDATSAFIDRARDDAAAIGVDVDYRLGDMRSLGFDGEFDRILNWFTSFGYFDDATDRSILAGFRRALKPGGKLLIETGNRDRILRVLNLHLGPSFHMVEQGDDLLIDRTVYDHVTGRTETDRLTVRHGRVRRSHFSVRLLTVQELRDWLLAAGFSSVEFYGPDGAEYGLDSRRMIAVACVASDSGGG